ncbi:molecular chaperone DnaJ [Acinetobacter baumannii]|uniref:Molecular chaperone DnaJ n=2 Tax=Acinetobacter baumannii TaxID=470 RepID=A0A646LUL6_ACIBA|nr:molecular chaperone DnaJ [Acinetobacter baumannii]EHZ7962144.1 molecular chaperone DnaJ [Acinetobacter baumannii]EKU8085027.1 molecular chaperone DnaJ [Acinetobacter baumannii]MBD0502943.1 molecular chaperone DnaJ [Acinetobacter baumannii]MCW8632165.1 molecular chaperone DnaJ [Acinetobacter baumannii]MCW8643654.1 molecular chaperone DnaJ [Acinetobacter baumannii]
MKYFNNVNSIESLKAQYKKLAFQNHPDRGGDTKVMQKINAEYDAILKQLINNTDDSKYRNTSDTWSFWESKEEHAEAEIKVKEALDKIKFLAGLKIEWIGVWLWVSGDTKPHKEALKEAGFRWNPRLSQWVFAGTKSKGRGTMSLDEIRAKYGCETVNTKPLKQLKTA